MQRRRCSTSSSDITKKAFADAIKHLLKKKSLAKISVKDIVQYCNISRNTFYYHFKDKYELINWIFYTETLAEVNSFNDPSKCQDSFINLCRYLHKNRSFYLSCFQYVGQNSLRDYLQNFYYELIRMNLSVQYSEAGIRLSTDELNLMARMEAYSYVGIVFDWVRDGMNNDYGRYFDHLASIRKIEMSYNKMTEKSMMQNH